MKQLYFDTNIFVYLFEQTSPFHQNCQRLITFCQENNITIFTSAETFQEIIHLSKNIKKLNQGLETAEITIEIADQILPVTQETIQIYLKQAAIYKNSASRDLIHLASCIENNISHLITYDGDFTKFKQLKILTPEAMF